MRASRYMIVTSSGASGTYLMYVSKASIIFFWYSGIFSASSFVFPSRSFSLSWSALTGSCCSWSSTLSAFFQARTAA